MRSAPISTSFVLLLTLFSTAVWGQSTGAISGVVTDAASGAPSAALTSSSKDPFFLPALHLRYALTDAANVRAAFTRTLARPNYYDLVPYQLVFQEDAQIARGNSSLRPTVSNNVDVLLEAVLPIGWCGVRWRLLQAAH